MISLYNKRTFPFGLLSNKADTDFIIDGRSWKTTEQYTFVNMFQLPHYQQTMSQNLARDPFLNFLKLHDFKIEKYYDEFIREGMLAKFNNDDKLRQQLLNTRGTKLVYNNKTVIGFLNRKRYDNDVFFDRLRQIEIPFSEVNDVVAGVQIELKKNLDFPNLLYEQLQQFAFKNASPMIIPEEIYTNINNIVPILKNKYKKKNHDIHINKFKNHLLDVYLDYLLETEYPTIEGKDYEKAKQQQISKLPNNMIDMYENQLFSLYEKKEIDDLISRRLQFKPSKFLEEEEKTEEDNTVELDDNHPFLPQFKKTITIDGKNFNSVVDYAYYKLFVKVLNIENGINFSDASRNWVIENLVKNNEIATNIKFSQSPTLSQLLILTGNVNLIWNDKTDKILGSPGTNLSGKYLEILRTKVKETTAQMNEYPTIASNIFMNFWLSTKCRDFFNTLKLSENLRLIYKITPGKIRRLPFQDEIRTMKFSGLNDEQIKIVFPLIMDLYEPYLQMSEKQVLTTIVNQEYELSKRPTKEISDQAYKFLNKIYLKIDSYVDVDEFIASILSNNVKRINYWGNLKS